MKKDHSLALLLDIAKLPRSTYYYWQLKFEDPSYTDLDPRLALVADEFDHHHGVYGYRRIRYELRDKGHHFSRKTVYHLLKAAGRRCKSRVKRYSSFRGTPGQVAPNIVARRFDRNQANHLWLTDVTMFQAAGRRVYLSAIKDVFNGEIVGHSVATSPTVRFVMRSLDNALATRTFGADLIIHSDQGLQYQHKKFVHRLKQAGITQSMSRRGNCLDNAPVESFFGHMKDDMYRGRVFSSVNELEHEINDYIRWYNYQRRQERLGGVSPIEYRVFHTKFNPTQFPALVA